MNILTVAGRLGKDAVLRHTDTTTVAGFSVAVDVGYGERKKTLWVNCSLWGKRAEALAPHLKKGQPVTVIGEADMREWQAQEGQTKTSLTCKVSEITLQGRPPEQAPEPMKKAPESIEDEDLPF